MSKLPKIPFGQIENQQIVDLRSQKEFQQGYLAGALNLIPKNLLKYGKQLLNSKEEVILITTEENQKELSDLVEEAKNQDIENITGYLLFEEIPTDVLETIPTISAEKFMALERDYSLLDVRHPDEITRPAPEKNLVNIPLEDLTDQFKQLNSKETVYTLCGSGGRATASASYLRKQGYQTTVIKGGMGAIEALKNSDNKR